MSQKKPITIAATTRIAGKVRSISASCAKFKTQDVEHFARLQNNRRRLHRLNLERESANLLHAHARALNKAFVPANGGPPQFAVNPDQARAIGSERGLCDFTFFADQLFPAGRKLPRA